MGTLVKHPTIGRPEHEPTEEKRAIVQNAASIGEPLYRIARYLGISEPTLVKHYRDELETSAFKANLKVGHTLYLLATECDDLTIRYRAAAFWAARKMGWTEKLVNVHTGPNGGPVQSINANMTAQEAVEAYQSILRSEKLSLIEAGEIDHECDD